MRQRLELVALRSAVVTPDLAEGLRVLERRVAAVGPFRLSFKGVKRRDVLQGGGGTGYPPLLSLRAAGREAELVLQGGGVDPQQALEILWGLAIPVGFTPFGRYPVVGQASQVFHFFGSWQRLYDSLLGEGRGEVAWPSLCAAAQVDVGTWQGGRDTEVFVQAQLHRLGFPCGPVDGIIGNRTTAAMRALGLQGMALSQVADTLARRPSPEAAETSRRFGYVVAPGTTAVATTGRVAAVRTPQGVALTIDGPGRVVVDLGGSE